ncbi:MAG: PQQ-binding-like beta-propeller repeat protein [Candidatus Latescibacteria bacterium]|nr:PQQ-binding-like beta-propeller repeat protein [Candidatus Latescibacterota bacterium]
MRCTLFLTISFCLILSSLWVVETNADETQNWPQWRGPTATGSAPDGNPLVTWSEQQNIRWKIRLPGTGYSTPAIWGNDIFVTAAIPPENFTPPKRGENPKQPIKYILMAIDRASGKIHWEKISREEIPHEGQHDTSTWATSSPITDGKYVYAYFGSRGLYCYSINGDLVWEKDFGDMTIRRAFGEGSSPALYKNRLIVNWDHEGQSFILALDSATGEEIWRKNRDEVTTWMTPLVVEESGKAQVIATATNRVRSYDLNTGEIIWEGEGLTANVIPSPVAANGVVYVISGHRGSALRAIRLSAAKGNIDGTDAVLWSYNQDTPYVPSPLLHNGLLYFLKSNQGILTCVNTATGQPYYANQRLESIRDMYASPVGTGDRVYFLSRDGVAMVIKHGPVYNVLATNKLDDNFDASPVIIGDELYLRGHQYLYCIAKQ